MFKKCTIKDYFKQKIASGFEINEYNLLQVHI